MIIITAVVTIMVTVIISTVARYVSWQLSVLGNPLYRFIIWHLLLFAIVLALFYDSRQGFKKSMEFLGHIAQWYERSHRDDMVNATMDVYREHARKVTLRTILLPIAFILFVAYILSSQMLFFAIVTSGSMEPTFKKGDLVFMQNILLKPAVGDIIIFPDVTRARIGDKPLTITHRVYSISGDAFTTKGDNNADVDRSTVNRKDIIGKAIVFNGKPVVLKDVGQYFLLDYQSTPKWQRYRPEFLSIAVAIQNLRSVGIMIFFACLALYLILSVKETRPARHFKYR